MRGLFLTLEGIEGSGKTTQVKEIAAWANKKKIDMLCSKEPGTVWEGAARKILLSEEENDPVAETFLFLADRAEHMAKHVRPALDKGHWVVLDRFVDSTVVYQGFVKEALPIPTVIDLNKYATGGVMPDLTILLDVDPERALRRLSKREDKERRMITGADLEYVTFVRNAFLQVARNYSDRFILIDANQSAAKVKTQLIDLLGSLGDHWLENREKH